MNAVLKPLEAQLEAMTPAWLDVVTAVESRAYQHPWSRGNFADSLNSGYQALLLTAGSDANTTLLAYFVAMKGVDEVHLLNITVSPEHQRQGWGRVMLDALAIWSRQQSAQWLWLEVRVSNTHASEVYRHYGFNQVGVRRNYYPHSAAGSQVREDAIVMSFAL